MMGGGGGEFGGIYSLTFHCLIKKRGATQLQETAAVAKHLAKR